MKIVKSRFSLLCALLLAACVLSLPFSAGAEVPDVSTLYKAKDTDASWEASDVKEIDLSAVNGDLVLSEAGTYLLSGTLKGQIRIAVKETEKVRLILSGVTVTSMSGPAIYEKTADKLTVTLAEGSVNTLTDASAVQEDGDTVAAALYANDDLTLNGSGELHANGTVKHGIQSKADLIVASGLLKIRAAGDGLRGRNSVLILGGELDIVSQGDGITSTRDGKDGKGWVLLQDGTVSIVSGAGAGDPTDPDSPIGLGIRKKKASSADSASRKGIKAARELYILGGSLTLDCEDDALHASDITVSGGTSVLSSGDDALHADGALTVTGGSIRVLICLEGLDGLRIHIGGGEISVFRAAESFGTAEP